ncbi:hypothetical protein GCM10009844_01370 [Nocardioides koreensis]|uniref:Uncharacterized protein n=1 Tax=Nocardioides koreensis TaxID=433651 RepID=A0ABN2Z2F7_9ACTN
MADLSTAPIRTVIVRITIGAFSLAALMGVIALIGGGAFGATEGRILLTTLLVGVSSVAVLCYLATAGTPYQWVGVLGGVVLVAPVLTALVMIWHDFDTTPSELESKTFGVGTVVAATLAQVCLLLALGARARPAVRRILVATIALAGVLAGLVSAMVLGYDDPGSGYLRFLGVVAILDVLGTVVVAALTRFGVSPRPQAPTVLAVPFGLTGRVVALAERTGRHPEDVVGEAVERYLAAAELPAADENEPGARAH